MVGTLTSCTTLRSDRASSFGPQGPRCADESRKLLEGLGQALPKLRCCDALLRLISQLVREAHFDQSGLIYFIRRRLGDAPHECESMRFQSGDFYTSSRNLPRGSHMSSPVDFW